MSATQLRCFKLSHTQLTASSPPIVPSELLENVTPIVLRLHRFDNIVPTPIPVSRSMQIQRIRIKTNNLVFPSLGGLGLGVGDEADVVVRTVVVVVRDAVDG